LANKFRIFCATALIGGLACGHDTPTAPPILTITSSQSIADTIGTLIGDPIVAIVTQNGAPAVGVDVVVRCDTPPDASGSMVLFARTPGDTISNSLTLRTDATGRVQLYVLLGDRPGDYNVRMTVPQLGLLGSVTVTVRVGRAMRIAFAVPDTAATVSASYALGARALDRAGNVAAEAVAVATSNPTVAAYSSQNGIVTAVATGRTYLSATVNGVHDSAWISVVPPGRLLAFRHRIGSGEQTGFYMFNTDGSRFRIFSTTNYAYNNRSPYFLPVGDRVVYHDVPPGQTSDQMSIWVSDTSGSVQLLRGGGTSDHFMYPQPSRDGSWIYFMAITGYQVSEVWRMKPDGTEGALVGPAGTFGTVFGVISPSPNGDRLAIGTSRQSSTAGVNLDILDLASGTINTIRESALRPRWSPVADESAYIAGGAIFVVRPDGTDVLGPIRPTQLAFDQFDGNDGQLDWSRDGQWLVSCATGEFLGARYVALVSRATGQVIQLPFTRRLNLCGATWRPT